jgi:hypothetical protein
MRSYDPAYWQPFFTSGAAAAGLDFPLMGGIIG